MRSELPNAPSPERVDWLRRLPLLADTARIPSSSYSNALPSGNPFPSQIVS